MSTIKSSLVILVCLWSASAAAQPPSVTDVDRVRLRADELADLLGVPAPERDLGIPAEVDLDAIGAVYTQPGDLPRLKIDVGGEEYDLPLEHTHADIRVSGHAARVKVRQTFKNPLPDPIEAIYIFPLPENSAVHGMRMVIGERVIEAVIKKRQEARQEYDDARRAGHTAALLEQERPNIFTQSVANIPPGGSIDVVIDYAQLLTYDSGEYEVVFPMVVGPRFIPGNPRGHSGPGWHPDTDDVPDASRITPPVVGGGFRSGNDISLDVRIDAGVPIHSWDVPTHDVEEIVVDGNRLVLSLCEHDRLPNRDFILRYQVAGKRARATLLTHRPGADGAASFTLLVQPPELDVDRLVGRREIIFVVDVSGSMHGVPLSLSKDAMRAALGWVRPVDTFNVITFAGSSRLLFEAPRPANDVNVRNAMELIDGLRAGGGTMMSSAVEAALRPQIEDGRHRYVVFLTDGYVGNENQIFSLAANLVKVAAERGQKARVFAFGIGSSPNRHLISGLAKAGRGIEMNASTRQDPAREINRLFRVIDRPILSNVQVDWGDLRVSEVYPEMVPDAFASRPWVLHGKIRGAGRERIRVSGRANGRLISMPIDVRLDDEEIGDPVQTTLWARAKVGSLEQRIAYEGGSDNLIDEITETGLQHGLVTAYTSFVAVDRSRKVEGQARTILQPVEAPEGVNPHMAGAKVVGSGPKGAVATASNLAPVRGRGKGYRVSGLLGRLPGNSVSVGGGGAGGVTTKGGAALLRGGGLGHLSGKRRAVGGMVHKNPKAMRSQGQGTLSRDEILKVVNKNMAQIQRCYERELLKAPGLSGKLVIEWTIGEDGRVKRVRVKFSSLGNAAVQACIVRFVRQWKFPKPRGGEVVVNYPFMFRSVGF